MAAGIGDFFESLGALASLRKNLPDAHVTLLVSSKVYDYAAGCPWADAVLAMPSSRGRISAGIESIKLVKQLAGSRFDAALNLHEIGTWRGAARMAALITVSGAKITIGRNTAGKGFFFSETVPDDPRDTHNQQWYYRRLVELLTHKPAEERSIPWINPSDTAAVEAMLARHDITAHGGFIAVNPGSDRLTRRWDTKFFAESADHFARNLKIPIIVLGNNKEQELAANVVKLCREKACSAAGQLTIGQLAALIGRATMVITTNSAAMHIAAIMGAPLVAVGGSGNPARDMPEGNPSKIAFLWKNVNCNPCYKYRCATGYRCMKAITPADAISAGEKINESTPPHHNPLPEGERKN